MSGHTFLKDKCTRCGKSDMCKYKQPTRESYFCTASGIKFFPFDPCLADIRIDDVAHGLSRVQRFGGHHNSDSGWYSVAEHSIYVSRLVPRRYALRGLLHDASEGMGLNDMISPVKRWLKDYEQVESIVQSSIFEKCGVPVLDPAGDRFVKQVDTEMLSLEQTELQPRVAWLRAHIANRGVLIPDIKLECWAPVKAKTEWLRRYEELKIDAK